MNYARAQSPRNPLVFIEREINKQLHSQMDEGWQWLAFVLIAVTMALLI